MANTDNFDPKSVKKLTAMEILKRIGEVAEKLIEKERELRAKGLAQNEIRLTLFNDKGEVIFENATCVGYGDEDAIPVVKGFTVGLIDRQGSWNAKNSKYTQETDD